MNPGEAMKNPIRNDRLTGHDFPGVRSAGFVQFELDELEFGFRVAVALDDPMQTFWVLYEEELWAAESLSGADTNHGVSFPGKTAIVKEELWTKKFLTK
jgi:hypothetical protein